jgi:hypothetical protein
MFGNGLHKRISGPKRKEVTGGWRKWHIEEHHLYHSPNVVRMIKTRG